MFTSLLTCNRCNDVEEHTTRSCPKPANYVRCSEYGSEDHSYRSCTATVKSCFNCGGEHIARAMWCPKRKEALKKKEEVARQSHVRPSVTFAQAAQGSQPPKPTVSSTTADPSQTLTGLMCLLHAHLANASSPCCFQQILSASLAQNGLPDVKLPPRPPLRGPEDIEPSPGVFNNMLHRLAQQPLCKKNLHQPLMTLPWWSLHPLFRPVMKTTLTTRIH